MNSSGIIKSTLVVLVLLLIAAVAVFSVSCSEEDAKEAGWNIGVVVTIPPLIDFVEQVGGDNVDVTVMVEPGEEPHTSTVEPSQLEKVNDADMYVMVGSGVEFEIAYMDAVRDANSHMLIVDSSEGIELMGTDPHVWNSPTNAKIMVNNICEGLILADEENEQYYIDNRDEYLRELEALDTVIARSLSQVENRKFLVFHPSWGYFARDYGLEQMAIEVEGNHPKPQGVASVIDEAREYDIGVVFISPQFDRDTAEVVADEIDGRIAIIDPLAESYVSNMLSVLIEFVVAMDQGT